MTLRFQDYRNVFFGAILILVLLAASPALSSVVSSQKGGEKFSDIWLLGPNHVAEDYPFNISVGDTYTVYLGVGNHMGGSMYYLIYVKFRNQSQSLPNATLSTPSPLPAHYDLRAFVQDEGTWERPIVFSVAQAAHAGNSSFVDSLILNGRSVWVNSTAVWDSEKGGFYYQLFFELWVYNASSDSFQFHNRFVGIWLNMTG